MHYFEKRFVIKQNKNSYSLSLSKTQTTLMTKRFSKQYHIMSSQTANCSTITSYPSTVYSKSNIKSYNKSYILQQIRSTMGKSKKEKWKKEKSKKLKKFVNNLSLVNLYIFILFKLYILVIQYLEKHK